MPMTIPRSAPLQPDTAQPPRRWWRFLRDRRVVCPAGHHVKHRADFTDVIFLPCDHWIAAENRECGRLLFLFWIRGGGVIAAEVYSLDEKDVMKGLATPFAMIEYLQIPELAAAASACVEPTCSATRPSDHHQRRR
jgi:hypothetical protein